MAEGSSKERAFSRRRYLVGGVVVFAAVGVVLGVVLSMGLLDGYFASLPLWVLFYALVGLGSGLLSRRMMRAASLKIQSLLLTVSLGRLLLVVVATALGLWLLPGYRWSFVLLSMVCYVVAALVSLMAVLRK